MDAKTWPKLKAITGGLSAPGKMPCSGWSIPAKNCQLGSVLRSQGPDSVCSACYALKGRYVFPNVRKALERRLAAYTSAPVTWVDGMVDSILKTGASEFRWFDSGDIQCVAMLRDIVSVARRTPNVQHWLPTRERPYVAEYVQAGDKFPKNLCVRLSANKRDSALTPAVRGPLKGLPVSVVRKHAGVRKGEFECKAPAQGGACLDCRACWSKSTRVVSYAAH